MAYELLLPKFGMAMESAKIIAWKKEVGDRIVIEEAVLTVENEKLTSDILSMVGGILLRKVAQVGEKYLVGDVLAYIGEPGETVEEYVQERGKRVAASPLAKKIAETNGLDISKLTGTGPDGRIVKADVEKYLQEAKPTDTAAAALSEQTPLTMENKQMNADYFDIPYTGMRQIIGNSMQNAWSTVPMVTHHVKADVCALLDVREAVNKDIGDGDDNVRVSINDIFLKLTAAALKKKPIVNSALVGDVIRVYKYVNLGIATALENGLVVPVIKDADKKSLLQLSCEAKSLINRARNGKLTPDDIAGGTFTVSNLGGYGSVDGFTPIINPPQAAILGIGRIVDTPVCHGVDVVIRPTVTLSFTYDHRIVDGAVAAEFIKILMGLLTNPIRALCE